MMLQNYDDANIDYQKAKELDPSKYFIFNNHQDDKEIEKKIEEAKQQNQKKMKKDYYKILEIDKNATTEDIKKAYRKLAKKWHPNRNNSGTEEEKKQAEKRFKDINDANIILNDPKKRKIFDCGGDPEDPNGIFSIFK